MYFIMIIILSVNYVSFDKNGKHEFKYIGRSEQISLKRGKYEIDIYGAQGGGGWGDEVLRYRGGEGAYIHAEFYISSPNVNTYYVTVGEQGVANSRDKGTMEGPNRGGFNGGGSGGKDIKWSDTVGMPNDATGGGGGATDIRINNNKYQSRVIVAAGGSGTHWHRTGAPGGNLCGMKFVSENNFVCSPDTNTYNVNGKTCLQKNGVGQNGKDHTDTPGSGAGGGFCGGRSYSDPTKNPVADSGSSYAKECKNKKYDDEICFFNVKMKVGGRKGDGLLVIKKIWECQNKYCLYCKDASNKCYTCMSNYLRYNGGCVKNCPDNAFKKGNDCFDCVFPCKKCANSANTCTDCFDNYYLNETTHKCIHYPTHVFSNSNYFSKSEEFSDSFHFSNSDFFSFSSQFSESELFSESNCFSKTSSFSYSQIFSESFVFTESKQFSNSLIFTNSNLFSPSIPLFRNSYTMTISFVKSYVFRKSVSHSLFIHKTISYTISFYNGTNNVFIIESNTYEYSPYIIQFLTQSYVTIIIYCELPIIKKKLTKGQLICIVCGLAALLFIILYIVIMIYRKIKKDDILGYDEYSNSTDEFKVQKEIDSKLDNHIVIDDDSDVDIKFWL